MVRRAPSRAYLTVGIAATTLVLTLVVATVSTGSVLGVPRHPRYHPPTHHGPLSVIHRGSPDPPGVPSWLSVLSLLTLAAAVVALILLARGERRAFQRRLMYDEEEESPPGDWAALLSVELGQAAAEQLLELTRGTPRNAIVACWLRLQVATRRVGLRTEPSETSREFTVRALRLLHLDGTAIATLSELYREARFSAHEMDESQRSQAVAALDVLARQLGARPASGFSPEKAPVLDSLAL
jgi:Domain of unknown function (DUF4129)